MSNSPDAQAYDRESLATLDQRLRHAKEEGDEAALLHLLRERSDVMDTMTELGIADAEPVVTAADKKAIASMVGWLTDRLDDDRAEGRLVLTEAQLADIVRGLARALASEPLLVKMLVLHRAEWQAFDQAPADGITGRALDAAMDSLGAYLRETW